MPPRTPQQRRKKIALKYASGRRRTRNKDTSHTSQKEKVKTKVSER